VRASKPDALAWDPAAEDGDLAADPARAFRDRARQLLGTWTSPGHQRQVIDVAGGSGSYNLRSRDC